MNKLIKFITLKLIKYCEKRGKVFVITPSETNRIYMIRYLLFVSKYCNIYIHRFLSSDSETPHDHPFNFITYIVDGEYTEEFYKPITWYFDTVLDPHGNRFEIQYNKRKKGSLAFRKASDVHRVILNREYSLEENENTPLTICITGRRIRDWYFWPGEKFKRLGKRSFYYQWIHSKPVQWQKYLGLEVDDTNKRG